MGVAMLWDKSLRRLFRAAPRDFAEWLLPGCHFIRNDLVGPVSKTRGFNVDDDIQPIHHAQGGATDLTFAYDNFKLVGEMTLTSGSRQFAVEASQLRAAYSRLYEQWVSSGSDEQV